MRTASCIAVLAWLAATPAQADCCFLWEDDGSRSACKEDVPTKQECEKFRCQGEWDRCYLIELTTDERCTCEDSQGERKGELAVKYGRDRGDLDYDGDRVETARRRYVVSVGAAQVTGGRCREQHRLFSGWTDSEYS